MMQKAVRVEVTVRRGWAVPKDPGGKRHPGVEGEVQRQEEVEEQMMEVPQPQ